MGLLALLVLLTPMAQSSSKQPPLIEAIKAKNIDHVRALLKAKADPNVRETVVVKPSASEGIAGGNSFPGDSALQLAAERSITLVTLLLDHKADPNIRGAYDWTPLMAACQRSDAAVVKLLLKRGAKPNLRNAHGDTAIIFAANTDQLEMVRALVDAKADMNGGTGQSALAMAAQSGATKTVKFLLSRGANPNVKGLNGWTALDYARYGSMDTIASLIEKAGGKGRSKAALDKEVESYRAKLKSEYEKKEKQYKAKNKTKAEVKPEDALVIQAVIDDFKSSTEYYFRGDKKGVQLVDESDSFTSGSENQMNHEIEWAGEIGLDMRRDLLRRNVDVVDLSGIKFARPVPFLSGPRGFDGPTWISVCLPGFAADGQSAVVRLSFGPTAHGAAATCLLKKQNGVWKVVRRGVAYYA